MTSAKYIIALLLSSFPLMVTAQHLPARTTATEHHGGDHDAHFRAAIMLGHTLITPGDTDTRLFVPSWGVDIEYWASHRLGIGLHTDIELQDFVVLNQNQEEVERNDPFILTIDGLYRPWKNLILMGGPGLELEQGHAFWLFRAGFEYEVPVGTSFDLFPSIFYDQRFDGYSTLTIGLGVGRRF